MKTLYILNYNNYFNRLVKREEELSAYEPYVIYMLSNVNFNENDGIDTEHVIGSVEAYDGSGDYMLAVDEDTRQIQRWFILEAQRTRGGQYRVMLRRDVVADYYNVIIESPCFIEKATASPLDVAIYNSENMSFNQIKTSQELIQEDTGLAWLVCYIEKERRIEGTIDKQETLQQTLVVQNISEWELYPFTNLSGATGNNRLLLAEKYRFIINIRSSRSGMKDKVIINLQDIEDTSIISSVWKYGESGLAVTAYDLAGVGSYKQAYSSNNYKNLIQESRPNIIDEIPKFGYTYVYDETSGKKYSVQIVPKETDNIEESVWYNNQYSNIYYDAKNRFDTIYKDSTSALLGMFQVQILGQFYEIILSEVKEYDTLNYELAAARPQAPEVYDVFAIPYGIFEMHYTGPGGGSRIFDTRNIAIQWAENIAKNGDGAVYDVQLLPFNPLRDQFTIEAEVIETDQESYRIGVFDFDESILTDNNVSLLYEGEQKPSSVEDLGKINLIGFWSNTSKFNLNLNSPTVNINLEDYKIENECSIWRVNSPNWASTFEMNVVKNGGSISGWKIDCHYKPYTPYINVAPIFSGLYGQNFEKEARGLVLSGDFSISRVKGAWESYQLQNKTYEAAFNRQIQSLELQNKQQDIKDIAGAISGTMQGAVYGAIAGSTAGPYGAIAGAVVGGVASGVAGAVDVKMNKELRADQLDLTKDLYGYNLQNIQARPDTLTNVSVFNNDNTVFPNLEYYTCTETEKQALKNKIKYNGMTIMRIGTISDFIRSEPSYVKARLIRLEGTSEDFHIINEISNELYKGVFI